MLNALFEVTVLSVSNAGCFSMMLEASLEQHFKEEDSDEEEPWQGDPWTFSFLHHISLQHEPLSTTTQVLGYIVLTSGEDKLDAFLGSSAKERRLLLLYAFTTLKPFNMLKEKTTLVQLITSWWQVSGKSIVRPGNAEVLLGLDLMLQ